ncbi:MAG: tripartite tricarboxylate transporter substrate binding protein [Candidatus Rokubacteria bacterium]|nr:tripartite tricarboxylate transporter substrate binding protein [Candidatus Rokubacteria bacterium]
MKRALSVAILLAGVLVSGAAAQEPYPARPVTIVVAFPPGGLADLTARPLAAALERLLKQPVIVANKPGAAGAVGNHFVATSKPDGYTLLMALVSVSTLPEVDKLLGRPQTYTIDQLTGIARINAEPSILTARGDAPWKTVRDVVEDAKRRPGQIIHTSSGLYGASHVPFAMFLQAAGLTMRHLPTTGGGPMMNALLGGHAEIVASVPALVSPHLSAGKVRLLAHTGIGRLAAFPDVPSLKELGYDVEYYAWAGLVAPKGTPPPVLKILGDAVRQAVKEPEVLTASQKLQSPIAYQDAEEFNAWWRKDAETLAKVIQKIGRVEGVK